MGVQGQQGSSRVWRWHSTWLGGQQVTWLGHLTGTMGSSRKSGTGSIPVGGLEGRASKDTALLKAMCMNINPEVAAEQSGKWQDAAGAGGRGDQRGSAASTSGGHRHHKAPNESSVTPEKSGRPSRDCPVCRK